MFLTLASLEYLAVSISATLWSALPSLVDSIATCYYVTTLGANEQRGYDFVCLCPNSILLFVALSFLHPSM